MKGCVKKANNLVVTVGEKYLNMLQYVNNTIHNE